MTDLLSAARQVIQRCRSLAECTEEHGFTTRTFLSEPMREVHTRLRDWMEQSGITVRIDAAGNLRGCYASARSGNTRVRRLFVGSHLDTVPRAGAFDGVLGVVLPIALVELLAGRRLNYDLEIVGFSEEEGVRFEVPFLGSRAFAGALDERFLSLRDAKGISVGDAIRSFGLDPDHIQEAQAEGDALGFVEFHIEQGPVLESLGLPLGVVQAVSGQSRLAGVFEGRASHAGTTPMQLRRDALAGASEWIGVVEKKANSIPGLVATVGRIEVEPGATNVIASRARASLDVRHANDTIRKQTVVGLVENAHEIASRRGLSFSCSHQLDQSAVAMDRALTTAVEAAVAGSGNRVHRMVSGAGHDAVIVAQRMPVAMLFLRSPGGISHHPDEIVLPEDVAAALATGLKFLENLEESNA